MRRTVLMVAAIGMITGLPGRAKAAPIINNSGISNPTATITFSEFDFPTETAITNQYASLGVAFSPALFYNVQPIFFPTPSLANFTLTSAIVDNPVAIVFSLPRTAAALAVQTNPGNTTFTAKLNGVAVESFTAPTALSFLPSLTHANDFFGFTGVTFNEIDINSLGDGNVFQIDNLQLGAAVPEPASLLMLSLGLAAVGGLAWRRPKVA